MGGEFSSVSGWAFLFGLGIKLEVGGWRLFSYRCSHVLLCSVEVIAGLKTRESEVEDSRYLEWGGDFQLG